jgi:outer membrane immunogenic protein
MRIAIKLLAAAAVLSGLAQSAAAADMPAKAYTPPPPVWSWTGFYVGVHFGGAWGTKELTMRDTLTSIPFETDPIALNSFLGGVQAGLNYQFNQVVIGVEAQQSWTQLNGRTGIGECFTPTSITVNFTCRTNAKWLGTVAGRFGFAVDRALIYAKGGGAWLHEIIDFHDGGVIGTNLLLTSLTTNRWGWMAGAGVEYAIFSNWSAKIEYNYLDFGTENYSLTLPASVNPGGVANNIDVRERIHLVKFGLNYRFNWGPVVAKY